MKTAIKIRKQYINKWKKWKANNNEHKSEATNCRKLRRESKGHKQNSMARKIKDNKKEGFKYIKN